jgi:hypothetical protein
MTDRLPKKWDTLSVPALRDAVNNPNRFATPAVVVEAIMYAVRQRGLAALSEPDTKERLVRCDKAAVEQIDTRIKKLLEQGMIPHDHA